MKTLARRVMRLAAVTMGLVGFFVAFNAVPGVATPPVGFSSQILARGNNQSHASLDLRTGLDIVTSKITLASGGSSGWHSHPGGAIATIQQGEVTFYSSVGKGDDEHGQSQSDEEGGGRFPHCVITRYTAGQSFVELPGEVGFALNTGSTDTIIFATFPSVPVGGSTRIDQPNPGTCPV